MNGIYLQHKDLGYYFDFGQFLAPALAVLWLTVAAILPHVKRNWFIGIRTPWMISDDRVWEKTNMLGAKLFIEQGNKKILSMSFPQHLWLWGRAAFYGPFARSRIIAKA